MMSDLPGDMTKQILFAPPRIMRSTRYSLTAQGRSIPLSSRLPTGSNSFEKASGWMRLPMPAAGTMPHMSGLHHGGGPGGVRSATVEEQALELFRAPCRGVFRQGALPARCGDPFQLRLRQIERRHRVLGVADDEDLPARLEERVQAIPAIRQDRRAAGGGLEQSSGGTPAHVRHGLARDIEGEPRGGKEGR